MKKFAWFVTLLLTLTLVLSACGSPATEAPAVTEAPTGEVFRVAVVMPSAINDLAFSQSMYDALVRVQEEMGAENFEFVYSENMFVVDDAAAGGALDRAVQQRARGAGLRDAPAVRAIALTALPRPCSAFCAGVRNPRAQLRSQDGRAGAAWRAERPVLFNGRSTSRSSKTMSACTQCTRSVSSRSSARDTSNT